MPSLTGLESGVRDRLALLIGEGDIALFKRVVQETTIKPPPHPTPHQENDPVMKVPTSISKDARDKLEVASKLSDTCSITPSSDLSTTSVDFEDDLNIFDNNIFSDDPRCYKTIPNDSTLDHDPILEEFASLLPLKPVPKAEHASWSILEHSPNSPEMKKSLGDKAVQNESKSYHELVGNFGSKLPSNTTSTTKKSLHSILDGSDWTEYSYKDPARESSAIRQSASGLPSNFDLILEHFVLQSPPSELQPEKLPQRTSDYDSLTTQRNQKRCLLHSKI